jgi:menaquinone-specific isochorismate synthase
VTANVTLTTVDDDRPLLELLATAPEADRFAFVTGDEGAVGRGVAARIEVGTGPDRFARAHDGLRTIAGSDDVVAFASFTFDEDDDRSVLVVPRTTLVRRGGATRRITVGETGDGSGDGDAEGRADADSLPDRTPADRPRYAGSTVRDDLWLETVAGAVAAIDAGALEKVVLARDLHLWSRTPFDIDRLLLDLARRFSACHTFRVDGLVGASPELLLARRSSAVRSRVLAGTTGRDVDPAADAALGTALLASAKDRHEHDLALRSAVDALSPACTTLDVPDGPSLVRLDNVQHLGSDLAGTLQEDDGGLPHVLDLLGRLHPTAAVGGAPRQAALDHIRTHEGMGRGRYAGPVGWLTADGDGEFAIALRCAEVDGTRARLFAGAGVVTGSLPEAELAETWLKLKAMTGVLDG